mgnify:CR=1 FL=1
MRPVAGDGLQGKASLVRPARNEQAQVGALFDCDGWVRFPDRVDGGLIRQLERHIPAAGRGGQFFGGASGFRRAGRG